MLTRIQIHSAFTNTLYFKAVNKFKRKFPDSLDKYGSFRNNFETDRFKQVLQNSLFYGSLRNYITEFSEYLRLKRKYEC